MNNLIIKILKNGGVGILLTDTLYGLVGRALDKKAVKKIYRIKGRNNKKPLIILISSIKNLKLFGIKIDNQTKKTVENFWLAPLEITKARSVKSLMGPGPVSIILPCLSKKFTYLHRGTKTLAFRLPGKKSLLDILKKTGPLVAPSANPEGKPSARNIKEAQIYFGDRVDFYLKGGKPRSKPSDIIKISKGKIEFIRKQ